jgi:small subunit ribosomal protein S21
MEARCAPGETIESLLRRFKKITQKGGILAEARKHEFHEKRSVRLKKKSAAARKRRT